MWNPVALYRRMVAWKLFVQDSLADLRAENSQLRAEMDSARAENERLLGHLQAKALEQAGRIEDLTAKMEANAALLSACQAAVARDAERLCALEGPLAIPFHGKFFESDRPRQTMEQFWTAHNVTAHRRFSSAQESLSYLDFRNRSYPGYIDLLPVSGHDGQVILDYGCGPGNDLVGFATQSRPRQVIGIDVSSSSLGQAKERLQLHDASAELVSIAPGDAIPVESGTVDYVHCSGMLMYEPDPARLLREFRRILKPGGEARLMVYNYDSIWLHLYVAYLVQVRNNLYADRDIREAFARTTDGEECPFVHVWTPDEMAELARAGGFQVEFLGAAMSLWEMHVLPHRFAAAMNPSLRAESRNFLLDITFDVSGYPLYRGYRAGIDGCYRLTPLS